MTTLSALAPDRRALVERAARQAAEHPSPQALALIAEHGLSAAEAQASMRRAHDMRICRAAFV